MTSATEDDTTKNTATSSSQQQQPQYGTFQGVANYPPPRPPQPQHASYPPPRPPQHHHQHQPVMGFPQPVAPPGATQHGSASYYSHGYQTVPGYAVAEGHPVRQPRLPCCGCGIGWFLFLIGWFLAAIPWYVGAIIILCNRRIDPREKPGYIACTIAAIIATIAILFGATKGADEW